MFAESKAGIAWSLCFPPLTVRGSNWQVGVGSNSASRWKKSWWAALGKGPGSALHSPLLIGRTPSPFLGISRKILTYFNGSVAVKILSPALGYKAVLLLPTDVSCTPSLLPLRNCFRCQPNNQRAPSATAVRRCRKPFLTHHLNYETPCCRM